jgi:hypothetical protein
MIEMVIRDLIDQMVENQIPENQIPENQIPENQIPENQIDEIASQYLISEIKILSDQIAVRKDMSGAVLPKMQWLVKTQ